MDLDLSLAHRLLRAAQPADGGERLLRLRPRVRGGRRPVHARRRGRARGCSWPSARAIRPSASSRRRRGCSTPSACRASACTASSPRSCRGCASCGARNVVNICGSTLDEYVELARILSDAEGVAALELNISCPNIKEGGIQFGCSLDGTFNVVSAVRKVTRLPVIPKLTPNVTSPASFARAAEDAGADAISLVNTFLAMAIDVEQRAPEALERRRRPERPGDPADRHPHGLRVPAGGEDPDHRHGRHHGRHATCSSSCSPAPTPCRSAPPTSSIRSSGRSCSTGSPTTCAATRSPGSRIWSAPSTPAGAPAAHA